MDLLGRSERLPQTLCVPRWIYQENPKGFLGRYAISMGCLWLYRHPRILCILQWDAIGISSMGIYPEWFMWSIHAWTKGGGPYLVDFRSSGSWGYF